MFRLWTLVKIGNGWDGRLGVAAMDCHAGGVTLAGIAPLQQERLPIAIAALVAEGEAEIGTVQTQESDQSIRPELRQVPAGRIVEQGVAVCDLFGKGAAQLDRMGERRGVLGLELDAE